MKNILVLTDFSKKARYAAETALLLAEKMNANVMLFNAYARYPFLPSAEFVAWPPEYYTAFKDESNRRIKKEKRRLKRLISDNRNRFGEIDIKCFTAEGTAAENLPSLLKEREIVMVVIGGREKTAGSFLFGNHMNQIIDKATCPVLVISRRDSNLKLKNVVFATNLDPDDITAVRYLRELSSIFHFHLQVCHVTQPPVLLPDFNEEDRRSAFTNAISKLDFSGLSYKDLEGTHVAKELELFCKETHPGLFVFVHKKHSVFLKLLQESPAELMIRHQKKPILVIPEKWGSKSDQTH